MFFDSLGQTGKDVVIFLFTVFTLILSIFIIILNISLDWWGSTCTNVSDEDRIAHQSNSWMYFLSISFLVVIFLIFAYCVYEYKTKGRIVGLTPKFGRRLF